MTWTEIKALVRPEPAPACPRKKCFLAAGHDEGTHGDQPAPRRSYHRPSNPNRSPHALHVAPPLPRRKGKDRVAHTP